MPRHHRPPANLRCQAEIRAIVKGKWSRFQCTSFARLRVRASGERLCTRHAGMWAVDELLKTGDLAPTDEWGPEHFKGFFKETPDGKQEPRKELAEHGAGPTRTSALRDAEPQDTTAKEQDSLHRDTSGPKSGAS